MDAFDKLFADDEWRICGRVKVTNCGNLELEGRKGTVSGCGRETKGGPFVIYVRLDGDIQDTWFVPHELGPVGRKEASHE